MRYWAHLQESIRNLYYAKLRTLLALLGILVGTASIVAMVLGGQLATNEALSEFKSLGTDLLALTIIPTEENYLNPKNREALELSEAFSLKASDLAILRVAPLTQAYDRVYYHGKSLNAPILGVTNSFADVVNVKIAHGRFITMADQYSLYCVIGQKIYQNIKKISFHDPIGQQIQIGKNFFTIVGIAADWQENSFVYASVDDSILVPVLASKIISKYANIQNIIFRLAENANIPRVEEHIAKALRATLGEKQFVFRSAKELITKMRKQSDILTVFLGLIGGISLLVGGIGVMNIMLVSVIERRREIGIRLAIGASRYDIQLLFLMEAVMLSLIGGTLGVIIGILIAFMIAMFWQWHFILFLWAPIVGFSVSVATGIFFGFYPAYVASHLDPITALRSE